MSKLSWAAGLPAERCSVWGRPHIWCRKCECGSGGRRVLRSRKHLASPSRCPAAPKRVLKGALYLTSILSILWDDLEASISRIICFDSILLWRYTGLEILLIFSMEIGLFKLHVSTGVRLHNYIFQRSALLIQVFTFICTALQNVASNDFSNELCFLDYFPIAISNFVYLCTLPLIITLNSGLSTWFFSNNQYFVCLLVQLFSSVLIHEFPTLFLFLSFFSHLVY